MAPIDSSAKVLENPDYLQTQLITCLGNKRALLDLVGEGLDLAASRLGPRRPLDILDAFSGSGIVSRYLKSRARILLANDLEDYARVISQCYLCNREDFPLKDYEAAARWIHGRLGAGDLEEGLLSRLYAPRSDESIAPGERVFYTRRNALYLDTARTMIGCLPQGLQPYFLGPLLAEASIHANTSGVFKGFYKNSETGLGQFGGRKGDALSRIKGEIRLQAPVLSAYSCESRVYQGDANLLAPSLPEMDVAYLDPPYNQHPYGSNYFMLNLLVDYEEPKSISRVSGIPRHWRRSLYNRAAWAAQTLAGLVEAVRAKFVLVSFSSEGFIAEDEMLSLLSRQGKLDVLEKNYNTFRGSRNLKARSLHVRERLYILEKS